MNNHKSKALKKMKGEKYDLKKGGKEWQGVMKDANKSLKNIK